MGGECNDTEGETGNWEGPDDTTWRKAGDEDVCSVRAFSLSISSVLKRNEVECRSRIEREW